MNMNMNMNDYSNLVEASNLYQLQLVEVMMPDMLMTFQKMYTSSRSPRQFQQQLASIVKWNKDVIERHTNQILLESPLLDDLIAAVYLAHVQVLSYVRLPGSKSDIRVQVPAKTTFVHTAYKLAANTFYDETKDGNNCFRLSMAPKTIIADAIHKTINKLLPLKQLLEAYIANEVDAQGMVSPEPYTSATVRFPVSPAVSQHDPRLHAHTRPDPQPQPVNTEPDIEPDVDEADADAHPDVDADADPEAAADADAADVHTDADSHQDLSHHDERGRPATWMEEGGSEEDMPVKQVELSPKRKAVMYEEADIPN